MDELPNDLRAMLDLARDEHDPPDDTARQRVRVALAAAIGAPTAVLSGGKAVAMGSKAPAAMAAKAGWLALGGKLTAAAVGTVAAASIGFAVYTNRAPVTAPTASPMAQPELAAPAPEPQPEPSVVEPALLEEAAPREATSEPSETKKSRKAARASVPSADTIGEEMALLRSASEALARGDEAAALVVLRTHAKRYPRGSLREERDGLRAIAECTRDQTPSQEFAQRFTRQYPNSVLASRVIAACRAR